MFLMARLVKFANILATMALLTMSKKLSTKFESAMTLEEADELMSFNVSISCVVTPYNIIILAGIN